MFSYIQWLIKRFILWIFRDICCLKYYSLDDLVECINNYLNGVSCKNTNKLIKRCRWLVDNFGLSLFDPEHKLVVVFNQVREELFHTQYHENFDVIRFENLVTCLILFAPNKRMIFFPFVDQYWTMGIQRNHGRYKLLFNHDQTVLSDHLNRIHLNDEVIHTWVLCHFCLLYLKSENKLTTIKDKVDFLTVYKQHHDLRIKQLRKFINEAWFGWWMGYSSKLNKVIDFLTCQNEIQLNHITKKILNAEIDPWRYLYDKVYKNTLSDLLLLLTYQSNTANYFIQQWSTGWIIDSQKDECFDWFDLICFDQSFLQLIRNDYPELIILLKIVKCNIDFHSGWQQFLHMVNQSGKDPQSLFFWQYKLIKLWDIYHEDHELFKNFDHDESWQRALKYFQQKKFLSKKICWQAVKYKPVMILKEKTGSLSTNDLACIMLKKTKNLNWLKHLKLWAWTMHYSVVEDYKFWYSQMNRLNYEQLIELNSYLSDEQRKMVILYAQSSIDQDGWTLTNHFWLIDNKFYKQRLYRLILDKIYQLSDQVPTEILMNESVIKMVVENQRMLYIQYQNKNLINYEHYLKWLNHIKNFDGIQQSFKDLISLTWLNYNSIQATENLYQLSDYKALINWHSKNLEICNKNPELSQKFRTFFLKIMGEMIAQGKLGSWFTQSPTKCNLNQCFNDIDYAYLLFLHQHGRLIDHWLLNVQTKLVLMVWECDQVFNVNPIFNWLYAKNLFSIDKKIIIQLKKMCQIKLINKAINSENLKTWLTNYGSGNQGILPWNNLSIIQTIETLEEKNGNRAIQEKHFSSL